jgi:AcrR family transcriptional regulator
MKKRKLSPRKTPQQERSRATVEALLEATADILVRDGYAKLTTNRIADRAGVNIASLYQYFPGKDAIVAELRRRHGSELRTELRRVLAERGDQNFEDTLRALVSVGVGGHAQSPMLQRVFAEEMPTLAHRDVADMDAPLFDAMRRFLRSAEVDVRDTELAFWIVSTAAGAVVHRATIERPQDLASGAIAEELVRLLSRYLRRDSHRFARRGRRTSA